MEQHLETGQYVCPQRGKGERASNMPTCNRHDWYATGSIAGSVVGVQHILIVLGEQRQDTSRVTDLEILPQVEERPEHSGVRQSLGCQKTPIVCVEHDMGNIGASEQRHIPVCGPEHKMMHQGEKPTKARPNDHTATRPTRQQRLTHSFAELHGYGTHGEKMLHAPESCEQLEPGAMKRRPHHHQVRLHG
jgi:hypothetical protein